jgi:hypothetical protein
VQPRVEKLREGEIMPMGDLWQIGEGKKVDEGLLTVLQVLVMTDEELEVWEEVGRIVMGEEYLEEENVDAVVAALLGLVEGLLQQVRVVKGAGTGAGEGKGLSDALKKEEARAIAAFKRAVLVLAMEAGGGGAEEDEEEEEGGGGEQATKKLKIF